MKCVNSSNQIKHTCEPIQLYTSLSCSIPANLHVAPLGKFHCKFDTDCLDHTIFVYIDKLSSRIPHAFVISGLVLRKNTKLNQGLFVFLNHSSNKEKVFPTQAPDHHITMSAGDERKDIWNHSCGDMFICYCLYTKSLFCNMQSCFFAYFHAVYDL